MHLWGSSRPWIEPPVARNRWLELLQSMRYRCCDVVQLRDRRLSFFPALINLDLASTFATLKDEGRSRPWARMLGCL